MIDIKVISTTLSRQLIYSLIYDKSAKGTSTTSLVFYTDSAAQVDIKKDSLLKKLYEKSTTWKWDVIMFTLVSLGFIVELIKKIFQLRQG